MYILPILSLICSSNKNFLTKVSSRCFLHELDLTTEVLRENGGFVALFVCLEKMAYYACLLCLGFNDISYGTPSLRF